MMEAHAELAGRAQALLGMGRPAEAERIYRQLLGNTHVIDFEYDAWLRGIADCYLALGQKPEAAYVFVYLQALDRARALFSPQATPLGWARLLELEARNTGGDAQRKLFAEAGRVYGEAGRPVLGAIALAQAGDARGERRLWERVLTTPGLDQQPYSLALVHFNAGLAAERDGDRAVANRHLVKAQHLLEEVADDFSSRGERERAFDCYAILLKLGKDSGSYENLAEGYINCIRVLKEDNLKFYALQYYEDFLRISLEREEFHAAAALCREAADYARRVGLVYDRAYMKRAAEIWWRAADKNEREGGSLDLTENALGAAIDAYSSMGEFFRVRECYRRLARLPLGEKKQRRYSDLAARYSDVWQEAVEPAPFPDYLRQQHAYPEIWYLDLAEWELDGDYVEVCASLVADTGYADIIRRCALQVLFSYFDAARAAAPDSGGGVVDGEHARPVPAVALAQIARGLGELKAYGALRPLERLFGDADVEVRRGVMHAVRHLYFNRSFHLVQRGLSDPSPIVRHAALDAVALLHFPHAFNPLTRIFREHQEPRVREVALESLGRIATLEAGEFLLDVLRYETGPLSTVARRLLAQFDNGDILPIVKKHVELEPEGATRNALEEVSRALSIRAP